jgi:hypothetical protein
MKRLVVSTLALAGALLFGASVLPAAQGQVAGNATKDDAGFWWQFVTNGPNGERQISPHFLNEDECERAAKAVEALLAQKYPHRYPLIGSCEQYR